MKTEFLSKLLPGESLPMESMDEVIASHFERLFLFLNVFNEDSKFSLLQTERAFRSEAFRESPTAFSAYQWAIHHVRGDNQAFNTTSVTPTILCFLLRELGSFGYSEIGKLVGLEKNAVARHIAAARAYMTGGACVA